MAFHDQISHLKDQIVSDIEVITIDDKHKIEVRCACGKTSIIGARAFVRRWRDCARYLCKSCHVKTYAKNPDKLSKFKKSFKKSTDNIIYKKKMSKQAQKLWEDPALRFRISKAISEDNKKNPKKVVAREKALRVFMAKRDYKDHLANISMPERIIKNLLSEMGVPHQSQFELGYYHYDFKVEPNYLIEVQGEYWHKDSVAKDSAKATYAHKAGYKVVHIWEHEFNKIGKIKQLLLERLELKSPKMEDFVFSDVKLSKVDTKNARVFLGKYHYLPAISKYGKHYGAFVGEILVAICTFSGVTRKETAERLSVRPSQIRELSRFCIHPCYQKKNFASFLLSRFVKLFSKDNKDVSMLVSFADHTEGHEGTIYKAANWVFDGNCKASYNYVSSDGYIIHKKTVWDRAKKMGMTESEYAHKHRYQKRKQLIKSRFTLRVS